MQFATCQGLTVKQADSAKLERQYSRAEVAKLLAQEKKQRMCPSMLKFM
jgi:hypothetical protein